VKNTENLPPPIYEENGKVKNTEKRAKPTPTYSCVKRKSEKYRKTPEENGKLKNTETP